MTGISFSVFVLSIKLTKLCLALHYKYNTRILPTSKREIKKNQYIIIFIFGKKLLRACIYCLQKPNSNKVFLSYLILLELRNNHVTNRLAFVCTSLIYLNEDRNDIYFVYMMHYFIFHCHFNAFLFIFCM
jgi:hypothetical protein